MRKTTKMGAEELLGNGPTESRWNRTGLCFLPASGDHFEPRRVRPRNMRSKSPKIRNPKFKYGRVYLFSPCLSELRLKPPLV